MLESGDRQASEEPGQQAGRKNTGDHRQTSVAGEAQGVARVVRRIVNRRRVREAGHENQPDPERDREQTGNQRF
jgi:hypothetical protein